jgi:four helix bundle protein
MGYQDIEESRMYQRAERLADDIWDAVVSWEAFAKDTIGKQLTRAMDSVGANIAESSGRFHPGDVVRFLHFARGSLKETRYWLRRAVRRNLASQEQVKAWMDELTQLAKEINCYISYQRKRTVKEPAPAYSITEEHSLDSQPAKPTN